MSRNYKKLIQDYSELKQAEDMINFMNNKFYDSDYQLDNTKSTHRRKPQQLFNIKEEMVSSGSENFEDIVESETEF